MSHRSGQFIHGSDVDFVTCSRRRYGNNRYKIVNNQFFNSGSPCQQHHSLNKFKSAITLTFEPQTTLSLPRIRITYFKINVFQYPCRQDKLSTQSHRILRKGAAENYGVPPSGIRVPH